MSAPSPESDDPWIGQTLGGRYRVLRQLGEGGIGCVYTAEHLALGRHVALKVLHEHFAATPALRTRFEREARALSRLSHPNVVAVVDFGSAEDSLFLVMELIDGETLAQRIRRDPPNVRAGLEIMRQILRALAYAHGLGIIHRDLKPGNVLVRKLPDGIDHVTVLDFGLAKFIDDESSAALTRQGAILGTPAYMAPEQAMGDPATAPADVYAATLILFEILTGQRPYPGRDPGELFKAHLMAPIPRIADVRPDLGVSAELEALVRRGLDKKASARFPDAKAMLEALDTVPELGSRPSLVQTSQSVALDATMAVDSVAGPGASGPGSFVLGAPVEPGSFVLGAPPSVAVPTAPPAGEVPTQMARGQAGAAFVPPASPPSTAYGPPPGAPSFEAVATHPGAAAPAKRSLVLPVAAGAVLLLVGIASIVVIVKVLETPTPEAPAPQAAAPVEPAPAPAPEPADTTPTTAPARPPARNPWTDPVPLELKSIYEAIESGVNPSRSAIQVLYRYGAAHRSDPRGFLLLGHTFANRGWEKDAMDVYRDAYARDPSSRGDPRMLQDLVAMAAVERFHGRATSYIATWYGAEAMPIVMARIAQSNDPDAKARLAHLRDVILRAP